jgi:hypothetical protein
MKISDSALKMRIIIDKAIAEHQIKRSDYDLIIHLATKDAHIDPHERTLLTQLHEMIDDKEIKIVR